MILEPEEKKRFIQYLDNEIQTCKKLITQLEKLPFTQTAKNLLVRIEAFSFVKTFLIDGEQCTLTKQEN